MKKIFRRNQLVITALALMIAVAGYFSYMNNNLDDEKAAAEASAGADAQKDEYEISDENMYIEGEIFTDEGTGEDVAAVDGTEQAQAAGAGALEGTDVAAAAPGTEGQAAEPGDPQAENPGEAVFTSSSITNLDYAAEMKMNREQIRSKNKETLLEIVNNTSISDDLKQEAIDRMIALTDIAERENAAEMLLEAKGFTDVVVSITDDYCDVVLDMGETSDAKRAQVEDIVKRKTNVAADKIVITPIVVGNVTAEGES